MWARAGLCGFSDGGWGLEDAALQGYRHRVGAIGDLKLVEDLQQVGFHPQPG